MSRQEKQTEKPTRGFYKRGNIWWFTYTENGLQQCKSTKCKTFLSAVKYKENYINNNNNNLITSNKYLFDTVALKFLDDKERFLRPSTIELYKILLKTIIKKFSKTIINDITKKDIKDYEEFRLLNGCSDGLLIKELKLLKSIFNYAVEYEYMKDNLFNFYKFRRQLRDYEPRERFLTPKECKLLIDNSNDYLKRLIIFALETGMRINEITNLLFIDIATDIKTGISFAKINKEISKNHKERFIPLSKISMEQVNKQRLEFPNSSFVFTDKKGNNYKTTPRKALETACKKSNIEKIGFHIFRHTFASLKLQGLDIYGNNQQPKSIEIISKILGHQSIDITMKVYAKFSKESLLQIL